MVSSNDTELVKLARQMSCWGRECYCVGAANLLPNGTCGCRFDRWLASCPDVDVDHKYVYGTDRAYNLQPLDLQGALGLVQMGRLKGIHDARFTAACKIRSYVSTHLRDTEVVFETDNAAPSWFGVPIICPTYAYKQALVAHLEAAGIQTRNYFAGNILLHPGYTHLGRAEDYPNAQQVLKRVFFIGCAPFLTEAHFAHIEGTLKTFVPPMT